MTTARSTATVEEASPEPPATKSPPRAEDTGDSRSRRRQLSWLVLTAAGLWLAFTAAHRLLSGRAWWWNLPDFAPPLAFLAVPVALLAVLALIPAARQARAARGAGAALVVAALVLGWPCAGVNLATLWHRPAPAPADAITVFSWNTRYWDELDRTGPGGEPIRDPDRFYRYLRAQAADVYLLQEHLYTDRTDWTPLPADGLDRLRREFPGFHVATSGGLVTLSRFPIVLNRPLDLRPWLSTPWPDLPPADAPLPAHHTFKTLRTDLAVSGQVVSFYNAHFKVPITGLPTRSDDTAWDAVARHDIRAANYQALASDVSHNPHPILLAGDLNTSPAMRLVRTLPDRLVDAAPALDSLYPTSWARYGLPLWRIDWVFTTSDVDVHEYRMVPQGDRSDHNGQLVVVSM